MHLSPEFGLTINEIENDGYRITDKVEMLLSSDSPSAISKSIGLGLIGFSDKYELYQPDLLIILGDRYEIYAASIAAMISCIPIAHIHGGESTEGLIDESIRHGITKMSNLHFVASQQYQKRVIQLGEDPSRVFNVGGLGIDNINKLHLFNKNLIIREIQSTLVNLELDSSQKQMQELLGALDNFRNINLIFTMPNSDTNGRVIMRLIREFCVRRSNRTFFTSLGQKRYLSCLKYVDGVVGNSSSGLIEVPSFYKGTINIGDRQKGRLNAESVINTPPIKSEIIKAINKLYSEAFRKNLKNIHNPYGSGGASESIIETITNINLEKIVKKKFYDLK